MPKRLGGDLGEGGVGAGQVDRAEDDGQRAVGVEAADGGRRLDAARPAADGDADAAARRARPGRASCQARVVAQRFEASPSGRSAARRRRSAARRPRRRSSSSRSSSGSRSSLPGQLVDRRLDGEGGLLGAGRAVGAGAGLVGQHLEAADVEVGEAVVAAEQDGARSAAASRRGAGVEDHPRLERGDRAVLASRRA